MIACLRGRIPIHRRLWNTRTPLQEEGIIEKITDPAGQKPVLEYPCRWVYKVIGRDRSTMEEAIRCIAQECACTMTLSNTSRNGRYLCLNLETTVDREEDRIRIYERLRAHPSVIMVL